MNYSLWIKENHFEARKLGIFDVKDAAIAAMERRITSELNETEQKALNEMGKLAPAEWPKITHPGGFKPPTIDLVKLVYQTYECGTIVDYLWIEEESNDS